MKTVDARSKSYRSIRNKIFLTSIIILIFSQIFTSSLIVSNYQQTYKDTIFSQFEFTGELFIKNPLERDLGFGKLLRKFSNLDQKYINPALSQLDNVTNIIVLDSENYDYDIIHSVEDVYQTQFDFLIETLGTTAAEDLRKGIRLEGGENFYYVFSVVDALEEVQGFIIFSYDKDVIADVLQEIFIWSLRVIAIILVITILISFFVVHHIFVTKSGLISKGKLVFIMVITFGVPQVVFSWVNNQFFQVKYHELIVQKTESIQSLSMQQGNDLLKKGIPLESMNMEIVFDRYLKKAPEIENITVKNLDGNIIYQAQSTNYASIDKTNFTYQLKNSVTNFFFPNEKEFPTTPQELQDKEQNTIAYLSAVISKNFITDQNFDIILNSLTILIISLFFLSELVIASLLFVNWDAEVVEFVDYSTIDERSKAKKMIGLIRPLGFIFLFSFDLPISFLALQSKDLDVGILTFLPLEVIAALPIISEYLFAALALIIAGPFIDKKGWQYSFFAGIVLFSVGTVWSALTLNSFDFAVSRGMCGLGYGAVWMSFQGYIIYHSEKAHQSANLANLGAGVFAGSICGGAVGGMFADNFGREAVFAIAALPTLVVALYVILFMRFTFTSGTYEPTTDKNLRKKAIGKFLISPDLVFLVLLNSLPFAICFVGVLYYAIPIYLEEELALNQSNIARILMIYGVFIIYFAPFAGRIIDKDKDKTKYIAISGLLAGCGLFLLQYSTNVLGVIGLVLMLSLAASFGNPARPVYVLSQYYSEILGKALTMSIYRSIERLGQALGPTILGLVFTVYTVPQSFKYIGITLFILSILFIFYSIFSVRRKAKFHDEGATHRIIR